MLLRDRDTELIEAGIRSFGISRDSPWSHEQWSLTLDSSVPLLSDWEGEATRGFGIAIERLGMTNVSARSAFLIEGDTVRAAWSLGSDLPDLDAVLAAALSLSP